jgi:acyl-CoA synthetase (AMP-forming)/AMP-acid ligase II
MLQPETQPLRHHLQGPQAQGRFFHGTHGSVALADLAGGTSLASRLHELVGRAVLLATADQLAAALALIELDGVARRIVLCPPNVAAEHLPEIAANAEIDAILSDRPAADFAPLAVPLFVPATTTVDRSGSPASGGRRTEWLLLTSGTTGAPKLVRHDVASLTAPIKPGAQAPVWGTFYDIRRYGGLQIFFRAVVGGGSLILSEAGERVADHLARLAAHSVTHLSGTPSHWRRALMNPAARAIAPRYVRLSGEIADQAILDNLRTFFPQAGVGHAYASTEAGVAFEVNDGLAGFPASFVKLGQGEVDIKIAGGSLRLRSARTATCYVGRDAPPLLDADGFVDTGDMVELSGDRYHFVGRKGGIINVGGQKVHPEEVEAAINRHPAVWASQVRARRNPITGAVVVADVVLKVAVRVGHPTSDTERDIIAACRTRLAPHKVPAVIRFVDNLDVSATGKLVRRSDR